MSDSYGQVVGLQPGGAGVQAALWDWAHPTQGGELEGGSVTQYFFVFPVYLQVYAVHGPNRGSGQYESGFDSVQSQSTNCARAGARIQALHSVRRLVCGEVYW